jgi:hypothetical protein
MAGSGGTGGGGVPLSGENPNLWNDECWPRLGLLAIFLARADDLLDEWYFVVVGGEGIMCCGGLPIRLIRLSLMYPSLGLVALGESEGERGSFCRPNVNEPWSSLFRAGQVVLDGD